MGIFGGVNLMALPALRQTFKGLLGLDGGIRPFECIGETQELREAYHMAIATWPQAGYELGFDVPTSSFEYGTLYESQPWTDAYAPVTADER